MYDSVTKEIPEFLSDDIIYCDILTLGGKQKSCLILLKNLVFYEFQLKVPVNIIDLSATSLAHVQQQLSSYAGKRGKWYDKEQQKDASKVFDRTLQVSARECNNISFGKYIYQNFQTRKLFLLIKCWHKLLALQRTEEHGLTLVAEYDDVSAYKLVHGKIKFQAIVKISFCNKSPIETDFHHVPTTMEEEIKKTSIKAEHFKQLLDRIRSAKTELLVHKSLTQREFNRLKDTQTFGCNFLRSLKLEEKILLARCGDIWMRLTANDDLVIGVPLVNNASATACNVLENVRPIIKTDGCSGGALSYSFRLYQLRQHFADLMTAETFFQCEDYNDIQQIAGWAAQTSSKILPESFAVLCIRFKLSEVISLLQAPLFIFFDIQRDVSSTKTKSMIFNQQVFIKNIDFTVLLSKNRRQYEICLANLKTLHQDCLAIAMTSVETSMALTFVAKCDEEKFEQFLVEKFDFSEVRRCSTENSKHFDMEVDQEEEEEEKEHTTSSNSKFPHCLYYNHSPTSLWHSTLAMRCAATTDSDVETLKVYWKFYTKTTEKTLLLFKLIFTDILLLQCNIKAIEYPVDNKPKMRIIAFENALREELNCALKQCNKHETRDENQVQNAIEELLQLELQTDRLAQSVFQLEE